MLISVDLPAPFSPTMPWMAPAAMPNDTAPLATTAPKRLETPANSTAKPALLGGAGLVIDVIMDLDRAGDDLVARIVEGLQQLGRQERAVILVDGNADAVLLEAERHGAGFPVAGLGRFERAVDGIVEPLQHRGQHMARMQVILVG